MRLPSNGSFAVLFAAILSSISQAAVLASYDFTSTSADTTTKNPTSGDSDLFSTASSFTALGGGDISGDTDMAFNRGTNLTTSAAGAFTDGDYFQFTVTPGSGGSIDLTSLGFSFGGSNSGSGSTAFTAYMFLRTNAGSYADDFSTDMGSSFAFERVVTGGGSGNLLTTSSFNFSGADFQNLTTPVTFRLYTYTSDNSNSGKINRIDNILLNGTAIPEPSALVLTAVSVLFIGRRRREVCH